MGIAIDLPQCRGIDKIHVPSHQLGEGIFTVRFGVPAKQFAV
jgi:hypothetical protein